MTMLAQFAAAAGGVLPAYIEDVFSTYLYTGNGVTQTINNGIDLAGKGGLTWFKSRASVSNHFLFDSARGTNKYLRSQLTNAEGTSTSDWISSFNSNGFSLGSNAFLNTSSESMVNWTFRKQPKFFDVVTYTGTGSARTVAHNLASVPGCIIIKRTDTTADWAVYHRSLANTQYLVLNTAAQAATSTAWWNSTTPTSTVFTVGTDAAVNASGGTYVAYVFAHNAGGFGLSGNENVISCGTYTGTGAPDNNVTLGYEPQFIIIKESASGGGNGWPMYDSMRGVFTGSTNDLFLYANSSEAEGGYPELAFNATGFNTEGLGSRINASGVSYIYIAIRRGPMKVPTLGTTVYNAIARTGTGAAATVTGVGFAPDLLIGANRTHAANSATPWESKLQGVGVYMSSHSTAAEQSPYGITQFNNDGVSLDSWGGLNGAQTYINWFFQRAPSFFDEVCWTGTGSGPSINHNLTVVPELIISKRRDAAQYWAVWQPSSTYVGQLNLTDAFFDNGPSPATTTQFKPITNTSGATFVAYLFATCAGVSKVGSYTGTGTTQAINCGFTTGARFVLIKRTDSTGDWYVWDSARGIVAGNDPYLLLNSNAAEVTGTDYIDTSAAGFEITSTAPAAINASGGSYIFLAVA